MFATRVVCRGQEEWTFGPSHPSTITVSSRPLSLSVPRLRCLLRMGNSPSSSKKISRTKSKEPTPLHQEPNQRPTVDRPVPAGRATPTDAAQAAAAAAAAKDSSSPVDKGKGREIEIQTNGHGQGALGPGEASQASPVPGVPVPMGANEVSTSLSLLSRTSAGTAP